MDNDIKKLKQAEQSAADTPPTIKVPLWAIGVTVIIVLAVLAISVDGFWNYWWLIFFAKPLFFTKSFKSWRRC